MIIADTPENEQQRLAALESYHVLDTQPESDFDDLTSLAAKICNTPIALVSLVDENRQWFKAKVGMTACETPREWAFCSHALHEQDLLIIPDATVDKRFATNPLVTSDPHIRFYAGVPLRTHEGLAMGTLCVIDNKPRNLTPEQLNSLRILGRQVMAHFELRRHLKASEQLIVLQQEQLRTNVKLKESEERFQNLADSAPVLIWMSDPDTQFSYLNKTWLQFTGRHVNEELGEGWTNHIHPDDYQQWGNSYQSAFKRQHSFEVEFRLKHVSGEYRWLMNVGQPRFESDGSFLGYIGCCTDITERKLNEEELLLKNRAIHSTNNGVIIVDAVQPDQPTIFCNAAFEKLTGYSKSEIIGKNCRILQGEDHDQPGLEEIRNAIREGREARSELRNYRKDGSLFWNELYIAPIKNTRGDLTHFVGIQNDITETKEAREELARSNAELQQFAYVASHDLQEPLRMVASYTQLLQKRYKDKLDKDANEFIQFAVDGANRMKRLIQDLLQYSRLGSTNDQAEIVDCHELLNQVTTNLSSVLQDTQGILTHDELPKLHANQTQLLQLFQNLIGNALKFRGSDPPEVHVSAKRQNSHWLFSVHDNGIGIPREQQEKIFAVFQRLHSRSEFEGTGIGLAICKRIVERHGGRIWVESTPGKGSTFFFVLATPQHGCVS